MIKVAKQDWGKFIRDNNPEVFTETHINQWIESNKELLQKSEANELTEEEGVMADNFKIELNHFTRVAVMGPNPDPLQKSLNTEVFYIREQQVDWDKADDGQIEKSRGGVYKDTSMNRKLGRVGQRFGGKKDSGNEGDDKRKRNLWIADRAEQLAKKHPDKSNDQLLRMAGKEWESKGTEKQSEEKKEETPKTFNLDGVTWEIVKRGETSTRVRAVTESVKGKQKVIDNDVLEDAINNREN